MESGEGPERTASLTAHKALPRNPPARQDSGSSAVAKEVERIERRLSQAQSQPVAQAQNKSEDISSWIRDPSQAVADPNLPLTPPSLPQDSEEEDQHAVEEDNQLGDADVSKEVNTPTGTQRVQTPVIQQSPPTPEYTPPRYAPSSGERSGLKPSSLYTADPSSTADSFKTALEHHGSDDGHNTRLSAHRGDGGRPANVGLGLGLEASEGSGDSTIRTPSIAPKVRSYDEMWVEQGNTVSDDPFVVHESVAVQQIDGSKRPKRRRKRDKSRSNASSTPEDFQASLERDPTTRSRTERAKANSSSVEKFAEQIQWPSESDDTAQIYVDKQRLSELSNATHSQVVQAFVVSTPPQRRQKLRHSSKNESLRTAGSPINSSNRSSLNSNVEKSRRKLSKGEGGHRISQNSDSGISMGSDLRKKIVEALPASEIPPRRSSLRRRKQPNLRSLIEVERSAEAEAKRPETAPDNVQRPSFDVSKKRPRATSDANPGAAPLSEIRGRRHKEALSSSAPLIPPRSSSLSAPTSRNNSRTTSLTSTSLYKHNLQQHNLQHQHHQQQQHHHNHQQHQQQHQQRQQTQPQPRQSTERQEPQPQPQPQPQTPQTARPRAAVDPNTTTADRQPTYLSVGSSGKRESSESGNGTGARHRSSVLATPFSMASMQSTTGTTSIGGTTTGPFEVNEATAIEIYPHNNTSVLVVQQLPSKGAAAPRLSASLSGNVRINLDSFGAAPPTTNAVAATRGGGSSQALQPGTQVRTQAGTGLTARPPPVVLIPPTPAHADPSNNITVTTNSSKINNVIASAPPSRGRRSESSSSAQASGTAAGPFAKVRRALSARRYSEGFISPLTRTWVSRSGSTRGHGHHGQGRRRIDTAGHRHGQGQQAKAAGPLSGFWRPRGFWNDLSDDEDDVGAGGGNRLSRQIGFIRTSIRGPGEAAAGAFARRWGSLRARSRSKGRSPGLGLGAGAWGRSPAHARDGGSGGTNAYVSYGRPEYPRQYSARRYNSHDGYTYYNDDDDDDDDDEDGVYDYDNYDDDPNRYDGMDAVERKVGVLARVKGARPFAGLQETMRGMRERRAEEKLERQREKIRRNIGPVVLRGDARPFMESKEVVGAW